jgi:uncharacterized protein YaeQ
MRLFSVFLLPIGGTTVTSGDDYTPGMTFVAAFYNFSIDLNQSDRGLFTSFRLKIPRHELESLEHMYARLIAYLHCYQPGQEFTRGISDSKEPTIWRKDEIGEVFVWAQVGGVERRKLEVSLKQHPRAVHAVYFFDELQVISFCHQLRGSKTNWVKDVHFYQIPAQLLAALVPYETTSPHWTVTIVDGRIYLTVDGHDLEAEITTIDIWDAYQRSLLTHNLDQHASS